MDFTFTGKNIVVSDFMKDKVILKLGRLNKLLPEDVDVFVTIGVIKGDHTVEVTIPIRKRILRTEVTANDTYTAIDEVVDIMEKQIIKYKGRLHNRSTRDNKYREELSYFTPEDYYPEENGILIEKTKRFELKPMDAEEAVIEMEMLNHNFYVFRNGSTDTVNVIYKRKNGSYGLIEPEY